MIYQLHSWVYGYVPKGIHYDFIHNRHTGENLNVQQGRDTFLNFQTM